ncbi:hypothetical protein ACH4KN_18560 [Streptomyces sp. NPDC017546]
MSTPWAEAVVPVVPVAVHQDSTRAATAAGSDGREARPKWSSSS